MIIFDFNTYTKEMISDNDINQYLNEIPKIKEYLNTKYDMMGWYKIDELFNQQLIVDINETAKYIKENCDVFLIIGIGGSYLGSLATIAALKSYFYNQKSSPSIYYVGVSLSPDYYNDLVELIRNKKIIINVISKSGTTLETTIFYQLIMDLMRKKYNKEELRKRVIVTTDEKKGLLRDEVNREGYKSFSISDDIGGRYSVFTPVGLLPMAVANINIEELYEGAKEANNNLNNQIKYAYIRKLMYDKNKTIEAYVGYEPKLYGFLEWLKQLYGESLGKEGKGLMPISLINVRDLHSLGQFVQDGNKTIFETVINIKKSKNDIYIKDYNKTLNEINNIASIATSRAHYKGSVLNNVITIDELNTFNFGYLLQFFMVSCAISGYFEKVNPFNQEGVEEYKKIMKELLIENKKLKSL